MKIYIHIGPPKTGTSAIQNWLLKNRNRLVSMGVYYPSHGTDKNGVSSGNVDSLFERKSDGKLVLSNQKSRALLNKASSLGANTILLSSEFFFKAFEEIVRAFPQAKFILYLRYDLEVVESSYNQSVKRHYQTKKFPGNIVFTGSVMQRIDRYLSSYGVEKFYVRYYCKELLQDNNLVADLVSIVLEKDIYDTLDKRDFYQSAINNSYNVECIEFKRWFNQFENPILHQKLDLFLQHKSANNSKYSLMSKQQFNEYTAKCLSWTQEFFKKHKLENGQVFIQHCVSYKQPAIVSQSLSVNDFETILKEWLNRDYEVHKLLKGILDPYPENLERLDYLSVVDNVTQKFKKVINPISKTMNNVKRIGKKLFRK